MTHEFAGLVHEGGAVLREVYDGVVEPVLGGEYVMTHPVTGRQFLCTGNESAVITILEEKLRLEHQRGLRLS